MTTPRPRLVEVAQALRLQLDRQHPGWRSSLAGRTPDGVVRVVAVAEVEGYGQVECVLHVRGGLDGEALTDEVVQ